ncbi:hypothetical protein BKA70DRAFT_174956 [Coprinopsis sp. MPI-PUGE-AT-0042]|nr:hypothetical protein BKA70DRAFT_174956 [Coprinopsis sp. MPI-PUGE-AT-0042]
MGVGWVAAIGLLVRGSMGKHPNERASERKPSSTRVVQYLMLLAVQRPLLSRIRCDYVVFEQSKNSKITDFRTVSQPGSASPAPSPRKVICLLQAVSDQSRFAFAVRHVSRA